MNIGVNAAKIIYGKNTRKLSYPTLFERVGFPRYDDLIECSAATWTQKMIYTLKPSMMIKLIKFPRSISICKIGPFTKPNSTRFKPTAINSAITCSIRLITQSLGWFQENFQKV